MTHYHHHHHHLYALHRNEEEEQDDDDDDDDDDAMMRMMRPWKTRSAAASASSSSSRLLLLPPRHTLPDPELRRYKLMAQVCCRSFPSIKRRQDFNADRTLSMMRFWALTSYRANHDSTLGVLDAMREVRRRRRRRRNSGR